ncbi:pathogenesis-related leaf protein 6 isoform X4, partial [Biomphalaria glabrata]
LFSFQLLWKNSTKVGSAIKPDCELKPNFDVCIYDQHCVGAGGDVLITRLMVLGSVLVLS